LINELIDDYYFICDRIDDLINFKVVFYLRIYQPHV